MMNRSGMYATAGRRGWRRFFHSLSCVRRSIYQDGEWVPTGRP